MKKKFYSLIACAALLLLSGNVMAQQGVLKPGNQTPDNTGVNVRRGDISNPNTPVIPMPDNKVGLIQGPQDVSVVFGAGESSSILNTQVNWPYTNGADLYNNGKYSVLVGHDYSKNAVVTMADNNGSIAGALLNVRFYNNSGPQTYTATDYTNEVVPNGYDCYAAGDPYKGRKI